MSPELVAGCTCVCFPSIFFIHLLELPRTTREEKKNHFPITSFRSLRSCQVPNTIDSLSFQLYTNSFIPLLCLMFSFLYLLLCPNRALLLLTNQSAWGPFFGRTDGKDFQERGIFEPRLRPVDLENTHNRIWSLSVVMTSFVCSAGSATATQRTRNMVVGDWRWWW